MKDVIIIGAGPAGISASLYIKRAGLDVMVLYKDNGALEKVERIDNYYANYEISGKELVQKRQKTSRNVGSRIKKRRSCWNRI